MEREKLLDRVAKVTSDTFAVRYTNLNNTLAVRVFVRGLRAAIHDRARTHCATADENLSDRMSGSRFGPALGNHAAEFRLLPILVTNLFGRNL